MTGRGRPSTGYRPTIDLQRDDLQAAPRHAASGASPDRERNRFSGDGRVGSVGLQAPPCAILRDDTSVVTAMKGQNLPWTSASCRAPAVASAGRS